MADGCGEQSTAYRKPPTMKKDILSKKKPALGVDISDSSLKIMLLRPKGKQLEISGFKESAFPKGVVIKDEIKDPSGLKEIIQKAISKPEFGRMDSRLVVASLPESKCFIRVITSEVAVKKEETSEAMIWEAEQHIPLKADEVYMDFQPIPGSKDKEFLFTAAPKSTVDPLIAVLNASGLKPVAFEIESFATARGLLPLDKKVQPTLIIDVGTNRSGFAIFKENVPIFTSSIEIAGRSITESISKAKGATFAQAEKIKKSLDLNSSGSDPAKVATEKTLDNLAKEIKSTLDFYKDHFTSNGESLQILIAGGGAKMNGVDKYLSKKLGSPVLIGDPWINIEKKRASKVFSGGKGHSAGFATVIGLAIRGAHNKVS